MDSCSRKRKVVEIKVPGFYKWVDDSVLHNGKLQIPKEFCWGSDGVVPQHCLLQTVSRSWHVDVKMISREFFLENGWGKFVVGNCLKLGEYVVLKYVEPTKFFVEIYGHNHCNRFPDDKSHADDAIILDSDSDSEAENSEISLNNECSRESGCGREVSRRGRIRNLVTINCSGNACFSVQMCRTHVNKGPMLTPRSFLRNTPN